MSARPDGALLSFAQSRLWFLDRLSPGSADYTVTFGWAITGELDIDALEQALGQVVARHDTLRSRFVPVDGDPRVVVDDHQPVHLPVVRIADEHVTRRGREYSAEPFDLATGPLWRACLFRSDPCRHFLVFNAHHIVMDAWSVQNLAAELSVGYKAALDGRPADLADLPLQYSDYAAAQRELLEGVTDAQTDYWVETLAGLEPLDLPTDRPRGSDAVGDGYAVGFEVPAEVAASLRALAYGRRTTVFTVLLAASRLLLGRYTGRTDVAVGTPIVNRDIVDSEPLIGFFANTLVLRGDLSGKPSFTDLVDRARAGLLDAFDNKDVPFEQVVQRMHPERGLEHMPLFQVMVVFNDAPAVLDLPGLLVDEYEIDLGAAKFDLTIAFENHDETIVGSIRYDPRLFDVSRIRRMSEHLVDLLGAVAADPDSTVSDLTLLSDDEARSSKRWGTGPAAPSPCLLQDLVEQRVAHAPDRVVVAGSGGRGSLTYAALDERADRLARRLRDLGVTRGQPVVVVLPRSVGWLVSLLAVFKSGGVYVPVDPASPDDRIAFVLADAQTRLVITDDSTAMRLPGSFDGIVVTPNGLTTGPASDLPAHVAAPEDAAYLVYTSGSTGLPKAVIATHANATHRIKALLADYGFDDSDVTTCMAPVGFDASIREVFVALAAGARIVLVDSGVAADPAAMVGLLARERVTAVPSIVPSVLYGLAEAPTTARTPEHIRIVLSSGERLLSDRIERCAWLAGKVVNQFGPTETTMTATRRLPGPRGRTVSYDVGSPVAGTLCRILDPWLMPCPVGVPGELYLGGPGVALGYHGRPGLTASRFVPDPCGEGRIYRTGDMCRWSEEGTLEFVGRVDHQLKIRGVRVEPGEVEAALRRLPEIREVVVVARPQQDGSDALVAYLVPVGGDRPPVERLRVSLGRVLTPAAIPSHFEYLDGLPLTANGKIDRRALPDIGTARPDLDAGFEGPRDSSEADVVAIWSEILGVDRVGIFDNFFDLGGHSLLATRVVSRLSRRCGTEIPLRALFAAPTPADLATWIRAHRGGPELTPILVVDRATDLALSSAQQRVWFLDRLSPGSREYLIPIAWHLSGQLDPVALQSAWASIVARHEVLRTTIDDAEGQPHQNVAATVSVTLPVQHVADPDRMIRQLIDQPFDLAEDLPWRAGLYASAHDDAAHVFVLVLHHVAADAWSARILFREMSAAYVAAREGRPWTPDALPVQYADFAAWQRSRLQGPVLAEHLAYWRTALAGVEAVDLPTDRPRAAIRDTAGSTVRFEIDEEFADQLRTLARRAKVTPFTVILACLHVVLGRYAGKHDFTIGTPVANRTRADLEPLVGLFVNTVVLRIDSSGNPRFRDLLCRVNDVAMHAFEHEELPFERLVEDLRPDRDLSGTPLFQTMLSMDTTDDSDLNLPSVVARDYPLHTGEAKFDLTVSIRETGSSYVGTISYSTALFDDERIEAMAGHLRGLLASAVASPDVPISELTMLGENEHERIVRHWARGPAIELDPAHRARGAVLSMFEQQVADRPADLAVVDGAGDQVTFVDLDAFANRIARLLGATGVGVDDVVGVCLDRGSTAIGVMLGVLKSGAAYLPLDPTHPVNRTAFMVDDSRCTVVVVDGLQIPVSHAGVVDLADAELRNRLEGLPALPPPVTRHPDALAYVMYTSGSTGRPKGVEITDRGLSNYLAHAVANYPLTGSGGAVLHSSLAFDMTVTSVFLPLALGRSVAVAADGTDVQNLLEAAAHAHSSMIKLTPTHLRMLAVSGPSDTDTAFPQAVVVGGEALTEPLVAAVLARQPTRGYLVNEYGPTETVVGCCTKTYLAGVDEPARGDAAIGRPIANTQLYVLDSTLGPCAAGVSGELFIGGAGVARGYRGRPAVTAERFVPNPFGDGRLYRTGDVAFWTREGELRYAGRSDHQVKIRGYRVEPGEIAARLQALKRVREAVVTARPDATGEVRLVAYLTVHSDRPGVSDLRETLGSHLPSYMIPSAFVVLDELPMSGSGKVDLALLPDPDGSRPDVAEDFMAPRTESEERVAAVWRSLLGVERVGVHDNFFALGGHSLLATRVAARLSDTTGTVVPLRTLFQFPTVAQLTEQIGYGPGVEPILHVDRSQPLPLSFAQQRLWFLDQLHPGSGEYVAPLAWTLSGPVDTEVMMSAFVRLAARHEVLRTTIDTTEGRPTQRIVAPSGSVPFGVTQTSEADVARVVDEFVALPLDLGRGPLWRALLVSYRLDRHVLVVSLHHIVADAWSTGVLISDLAAFYRAVLQGREDGLPPLPVQYADFASWQRHESYERMLTPQLDYWRPRLVGLETAPLPTDRPRGNHREIDGSAVDFIVPSAVAARLQSLALSENSTLFMVILAALKAVLSWYSGQDDIAVGTAVANRSRVELEPMIGFFVNTLVMRTNVGGDPSFRELLARVRAVATEAFANQDLPFERVVDEFADRRDLASTPLFQTMLTVDNTPAASWDVPGVEIEPFPLDNRHAKFDLTLAFATAPAGLDATIRYSTALFDRSRILRMSHHLQALFASVTENPDLPLSRARTLLADERRALLAPPARTGPPGDDLANSPLHRLVEWRALRGPARQAVSDANGVSLTYGELDRRANRLARSLRQLGAGPESCVAVLMERSVDAVVAMLAVLKSGAAYLPLDPLYPPDRISFVIDDAQATLLISDVATPPAVSAQVLDLCDGTDTDDAGDPTDEDDRAIVHPDSVAYVIYTSGSTGQPKGVQVTHRNACRLFSAAAARFGFDEQQVWLSTHSFAFDFSVWEVWGALVTGGRSVIASADAARDPVLLCKLIEQEHVTFLSQTPTAFRTLMPTLLSQGWGELRHVVFGGEALDVTTLRPWFDDDRTKAVDLVNMYGITETTVHVTWQTIHDGTTGDAAASPIGRPLDDLRVRVLDRHMDPVPVGVSGELFVGGPGLARGYLNRPGLTAERFVPDPEGCGRLYRTGDVARWAEDGTLVYYGRTDRQVKVRGFRIELGEIEARLNDHPGIDESVVTAREDEPGARRLVAYVRPADAPGLSELRPWLEQVLPQYMVPAAVVGLDQFPLTTSGKVDRAALPVPDRARTATARVSTTPRSPIEEALAKIWSGVLGLDEVGVEDNFFDLGGDSILSIQIVARAAAAGIQILPRMIFEHPTVREIASVAGAVPAPSVEQDEPVLLAPLTPIQRWLMERDLPERDHYNQSVLLTVPPDVTPRSLRAFLIRLVDDHPALRLSFKRHPVDGWTQHLGLKWDPPVLRTIDVEGVEHPEAVFRHHADQLQRSLDIHEGRVFAGLLADYGAGTRKLLLVAHHLVIDGISWRVLLDDMEALAAGRQTAASSASFTRWAHGLAEYAGTVQARRELEHWTAAVAAASVRRDHPDGANRLENADEVRVTLGAARTSQLVQEVPVRRRATTHEILLAALSHALAPIATGPWTAVDVEGHGREDLLAGFDLSRTVGWFTTIYPVRCPTVTTDSLAVTLKQVCQAVRTVPHGGAGFGILKYLDAEAGPTLRGGGDVLFNYLGSFDNVMSTRRAFGGAEGPRGDNQARRGARSHLLEVNSEVTDGVLTARFGYCASVHDRRTVQMLADRFVSALGDLIDHCLDAEVSVSVPADFPLVDLDQDALDALLGND